MIMSWYITKERLSNLSSNNQTEFSLLLSAFQAQLIHVLARSMGYSKTSIYQETMFS